MIDKLVKLANHLDARGFHKEANFLDSIIKRAGDESSLEDLINQIKDIKSKFQDAINKLVESHTEKDKFSLTPSEIFGIVQELGDYSKSFDLKVTEYNRKVFEALNAEPPLERDFELLEPKDYQLPLPSEEFIREIQSYLSKKYKSLKANEESLEKEEKALVRQISRDRDDPSLLGQTGYEEVFRSKMSDLIERESSLNKSLQEIRDSYKYFSDMLTEAKRKKQSPYVSPVSSEIKILPSEGWDF